MPTHAKVVLFIICVISSFSSLGQSKWSGVVLNSSGQGISSASIKITSKNNQIIAFGFSQSNGRFEIELSIDQKKNAAIVEVSHLSYENFVEHVKSEADLPETILLENRTTSLPEITVTSPPVVRYGDTLRFDVKHYTRPSDQNIQDILRRLPGVSIDETGKIHYRGMPISRFYIEGMDLLGGRYNIATEGLSLNSVRDIEIIEHHQPKQVFQDIIRPNEAAVNLKLKSNIALTGNAEVGGGYAPLQHILKSDVFAFGKEYQLQTGLSTNRSGISTESRFNDHFALIDGVKLPLTSVNQVYAPIYLDRTDYELGAEHGANISFLRKIRSNDLLKFHIRAAIESNIILGDEEQQIVLDTQVFNRSYEYDTDSKIYDLESNLTYEYNGKKLYFKLTKLFSMNKYDERAINLYDSRPIDEENQVDQVQFSLDLETTFRRKNKVFTIFSDIDFGVDNYFLTVDSTEIFIPEGAFETEFVDQTARMQYFNINSYTNLIKKNKHWVYSSKLGYTLVSNQLRSKLSGVATADTITNQIQLFENNNSVVQNNFYYHQVAETKNKLGIWKFIFPININILTLKDQNELSNSIFKNIFYKGKIDYRKESDNGFSYNLSYAIDNRLEYLPGPFYQGYIMNSNFNVTNSTIPQSKVFGHYLEMTVDKTDFINNLYYALRLEGSRYRLNYLVSSYQHDFAQSNQNLSFDNWINKFSINGEFSFNIFSKLDAIIEPRFSTSKSTTQINGNVLGVHDINLSFSTDFSYLLNNSVISLRPSWQFYSNSLTPNDIQRMEFIWEYFIKKDGLGSIRIQYDAYMTKINKGPQWNDLLRIEIRREISKHKMEIALLISNLTNRHEFIYVDQNTNINRSINVKLRPRQIRFSIRKRF